MREAEGLGSCRGPERPDPASGTRGSMEKGTCELGPEDKEASQAEWEYHRQREHL